MGIIEATEIDLQGDLGWNLEDLRADGVKLREKEEAKRRALEEHSASIFTGVTGSWRFETGTGVAVTAATDAIRYKEDETFNIQEALQEDIEEFPPHSEWEQDVLKSAKSREHYDVLKQRVTDKREFLYNMEDLGMLPSMGLQLVAEFANIPNYFTFGLGALSKVNKLKRFVVAGTVTGTANVAEEKFISTMYNDRTATDYIAAGALGFGLGWLGTTGGSAKRALEMDRVGDDFANAHLKNQVDEKYAEFKGDTSADTMRNLLGNYELLKSKVRVAGKIGKGVIDKVLSKELKEAEEALKSFSTVGAQQIDSVFKTFDPKFDPEHITPRMDADNITVHSAFVAFLDGQIPKAEKLPHEKLGLTSMAQSMHSSENPITRYMAGELFEHPEGVGRWNKHTAALEADLDFQVFTAHYAPEFIRLKGAWKVLAEQEGLTKSFDDEAMSWIESAGEGRKADTPMDEILSEFHTLYKDVNEATHKIMKDSGVMEAQGDLDINHLTRSWDGEKFHTMRSKYGDATCVEAIQESILHGNGFKEEHAKAKAEYDTKIKNIEDELKTAKENVDPKDVSEKGLRKAAQVERIQKRLDAAKAKGDLPDVKPVALRMAQALYNRFLNRASQSHGDANLMSSSNKGLMIDALNDELAAGKLDQAGYDHIKYILDTAGKDHKANPMKHQMGMLLGHTHKSGLRIMDFMNNDLGSAYASKTRYWLGRSAVARHGFESEEAFQGAIKQMSNHASDRGMDTPAALKAHADDKARLEAGWKMIMGQPVEDMTTFGNTAMRVVRKAMATASLGKLGFVQSGETGRAFAAVGITRAIDTIPALKNLIMHAKDGRLDTALLKDIEDYALGKIGDDHYMNHPDFRADDFGHKVSKAEQQLDRMSFWMSKASGWHAVHTTQKKFLMNGLSQKWYRELLNDTMKDTQLKDLGVPIEHLPGFKKMMQDHAKLAEDGSVYNLHIGDWEPELRRSFALMLHRKSANAIQDIIVGETPLWINKGIGKFLGQFRTFSIAALGKQTVHDYRMFKEGDKEAALAFQFMMMTSTMAVVARMGFDAMVLPEKERKRYLKNNMTVRGITKRMLNYHGQASPLVDAAELLGSTFMPNTWGNITGNSMYRNGRGLTGKVPGLSYLNKAHKGIGGIAKAVLPGEQMSKSDWNAFVGVLPLNSWYGFHALNKRIVTPALFD